MERAESKGGRRVTDELRADVNTFSAEPITRKKMEEFLDEFVRRAATVPCEEWILPASVFGESKGGE